MNKTTTTEPLPYETTHSSDTHRTMTGVILSQEKNDEAPQPEVEGVGIEEYESPQFHLRRQQLIDHYHWFSSSARMR
jgi:hypothetical protein